MSSEEPEEQPGPAFTVHALRERDRRAVFDAYARLWAPLAIAAIGLVFLPMFDDLMVDPVDGSVTHRFGTLWEEASRPGGGPAVLGIILAFTFAVLAGVATFRPRSSGVPIAIACVCALIILLLVTKPNTGNPEPDLSPAGNASLALAVAACVLGVVHAAHHHRWQRISGRD